MNYISHFYLKTLYMYIHAHCVVIYRSVQKNAQYTNKSISGKWNNGEFSASVLRIYAFQFL